MLTSDYRTFKQIDGNRKVSDSHVNSLVEAIKRKNLLEYFPLLLNERMEVIDGQHRLHAAMQLKEPVHYEVVEGLRLSDVMSINTHSKSWTIKDFVDSHIELGNQNYVLLKTFQDHYKMGWVLSAALLAGNIVSNSGGFGQVVKSGAFVVSSLFPAEKVADQAVEIERKYAIFDATKDRVFIAALVKLNRNEVFDYDRLIAKLQLSNLKIEKRDSIKYYLLQIEELYNFNSKVKVELYVSSNKS